MFKTQMDLTNTLDPFKLKVEMGNKLFFKLPNIEIIVEDGGEKSRYLIEELNHRFDISVIYFKFLRNFIFSNDQTFISTFFSQHTLENDIQSKLVTLSHPLEDINSYGSKLYHFDKEASQLNKLFQALYKYCTTKKILIDIQDIGFKKENNAVIIEINRLNEPNVVTFMHQIGTTKAVIIHSENTKELDDISLYLAGINYNKLEEELKTIFGDTITTEKPNLSNIQQDLSDMQKLIQSFLTLEISTNRSVKNASSFRYSYDNGVILNISEDETVEIGREFGQLIFFNKKTNSETRIPLFKSDIVDKPAIIEPIKAMRTLYTLFTNGILTFLDVLYYAIKDKYKDVTEGTFTFKLDEQDHPVFTLTTNTKEFIVEYDRLLKLTVNEKENHTFVDSLYFTTQYIQKLIMDNAKNEDAKIPIETFFIWLNSVHENLKTLKKYNN